MNNRLAGTSAPEITQRNSLDIFSDLEGELHETIAYLAALDAILYDEDASNFREFLVTKLTLKATHILSEVLAGLQGEYVKREVENG